jgi:hypothetical protein
MKSLKETKLEEALELVQAVAAYDNALKPVADAIQAVLAAKADEEFNIWWTQNCYVVRDTADMETQQGNRYWTVGKLAWRAAKGVK